MTRTTWKAAALLFGSGMCALIYQIAWQRGFRLIFGTSTAASAAVLAIFIGGLGLGGILLGRRADRHARPLALYAHLETGIALSAAATPGLLWAAREAYILLGGSAALGPVLGTLIRLLLAGLVLAVPTLLMGGTLPAVAREIETESDTSRVGVGLLYGINTLGSVLGCLAADFYLIELLGTRRTIWAACAVNLLVAISARALARSLDTARGPLAAPLPAAPPPRPTPSPLEPMAAPEAPPLEASTLPGASSPQPVPTAFTLAAAGFVGFTFFLMELVWYRLLGPLLGGTVYTFGLILLLALLGIGLGGAAYAWLGVRIRPSLLSFSFTCLLEGLAMAVPYALGDRVALLALLLRPLGTVGFSGYVLGWTVVAALVILPAAMVSGFQFPMLIALLGHGRHAVGRQVGLTYACNTLGAMAGSLLGGFVLLPMLSAPGCWRLSSSLLLALGGLALLLSWRREGRRVASLWGLALALISVPPLLAQGPTAVWRHSEIGVGRVPESATTSPNALTAWMHKIRRTTVWEAEGVESSVALQDRMGLAFVLNGKIDGHTLLDGPTQVMSGVLGALLHPAPKRALVIGLGTGSSAGWLGAIPSVDHVDAVELEPAILEVARVSTPVNADVMHNPKVRMHLADARELITTRRDRYDVIFSEPSNPYRAGIASLFTREYYQSIDKVLTEDGIFIQWVQAYEVSPDVVRSIYATLGSVFPEVQTWRSHVADLLLVASRKPITLDVAALKARMAQEPYRAALEYTWHTTEAEGVLARFVAGSGLARAIVQGGLDPINTDDQSFIEFGFARSLEQPQELSVGAIRQVARGRQEDRPTVQGSVDWARVEELRELEFGEDRLDSQATHPPDAIARLDAARLHLAGNYAQALAAWKAQPTAPRSYRERMVVADALAALGDEAAVEAIQPLEKLYPATAQAILARLRAQQGKPLEAVAALEKAFVTYRTDPWANPLVMSRALSLAEGLAATDRGLADRLLTAISQPFCLYAINGARVATQLELVKILGPGRCQAVFAPLEPWVSWDEPTLTLRRACYRTTGNALAGQADEELRAFQYFRETPFGLGLERSGR